VLCFLQISALKTAGEFSTLVELCLNHCQETRISSSHTQILQILNFTHTTVSTSRRLTLVIRHSAETQGLLRPLLVLEQRTAPPVKRLERCQFRTGDTEFFAQMSPQRLGHDAHRVERSAAHPEEANVQGKTESMNSAMSPVDDLPFGTAEREQGLQLKPTDLAREILQPQVGRLPALIVLPPRFGAPTIRRKSVT